MVDFGFLWIFNFENIYQLHGLLTMHYAPCTLRFFVTGQ